jgi:hypothetical protein
MPASATSSDRRVRVVVATTVLLSFISFWRAAAIVLSDLGSTAFYVGGIVEQAIGPSLRAGLVVIADRYCWTPMARAEARGVDRSSGHGLRSPTVRVGVARLRYGPHQRRTAARAGLANDLPAAACMSISRGLVACTVITITLHSRRNTRGLHESSNDALRIMQITTVMVVVLIVCAC